VTDRGDSPGADDQRSSDPRDAPLRAALLALGVGIVWIALARWRRRRPSDVW